MDSTPGSKMDLYARAAATLYGIISFDNFCKILDVYYGEGTLSRKRIMAYFWTSDNDDPIYYIQDELIVHASIFPDEIASTLSDIQRANPFFYEDTCGTRQMEEYLTDNLGISQKDAEEIVAEMVFVCCCGASPTLVQDALTRRGLPFGRECYLDLITIACEMEPEIRRWEGLGYTGNEVG